MTKKQSADEGRVALALITRFIIHLTVEGDLTKETTLGLLRDVKRGFDAPHLLPEYQIVRALAVEIDEGVRDDPETPA